MTLAQHEIEQVVKAVTELFTDAIQSKQDNTAQRATVGYSLSSIDQKLLDLSGINTTLSNLNNNLNIALGMLNSSMLSIVNSITVLSDLAKVYSEQTFGKTALQILRQEHERVCKELEALRSGVLSLQLPPAPLETSDGQT